MVFLASRVPFIWKPNNRPIYNVKQGSTRQKRAMEWGHEIDDCRLNGHKSTHLTRLYHNWKPVADFTQLFYLTAIFYQFQWYTRQVRSLICTPITPMAFFFSFHWQKWCPFNRTRSEVKAKVTKVKTNFAIFWVFPDHDSNCDFQMATKLWTKLKVG